MTRACGLGLGLGLGLLLLGCPRAGGPTTAAPPDPITDDPIATDSPAEVEPCGRPGQRFADYDWVPDDSRLTASILRDDPELAPALGVLASMLEQPHLQLPVYAALDFRNLRLQLDSVERVVTSLALDPGEFVELHSPTGEVVWLWPSDCPSATVSARALAQFGVLVRADFEHLGLRRGEGSIERFPFDLLLIHERAVALAPLERGRRVAAWLSAARVDDEGPGAALQALPSAPIRAVLSGPALLGGDPAAEPTRSTSRHRKLLINANAWSEADF
jgi:hypothetical protein